MIFPLASNPNNTTVELAMSTKNFPRVKVFSQVFFKKLAGFGAAPHKTPNTNYLLLINSDLIGVFGNHRSYVVRREHNLGFGKL